MDRLGKQSNINIIYAFLDTLRTNDFECHRLFLKLLFIFYNCMTIILFDDFFINLWFILPASHLLCLKFSVDNIKPFCFAISRPHSSPPLNCPQTSKQYVLVKTLSLPCISQLGDAEEERSIQERRGLALLKDVKRQLNCERRRADRLQDKLSQLLQDPSLIAGWQGKAGWKSLYGFQYRPRYLYLLPPLLLY